jgi:DNA-binding MarR family transcriptional regulator
VRVIPTILVTPIWRLAKLFADDRRQVLSGAGVDAATLDLLSVLRRSGKPYRLTTRELARRSLVSAGAISQRVARAEADGLITRTKSDVHHRAVAVTLTRRGHRVVESTVDRVLGREASLLLGLSPRDRNDLARLLSRLDATVRTNLARDAGTAPGLAP